MKCAKTQALIGYTWGAVFFKDISCLPLCKIRNNMIYIVEKQLSAREKTKQTSKQKNTSYTAELKYIK